MLELMDLRVKRYPAVCGYTIKSVGSFIMCIISCKTKIAAKKASAAK